MNLTVHRWNLRPLTPALSSPLSSTSWLYFLNYSFRFTCNLTCNHIKSHLLIPHCSPSYSLPLLKCLPVIILSLLFLYLHSHLAFEIQYHLEYLTQSLNTVLIVISFHDPSLFYHYIPFCWHHILSTENMHNLKFGNYVLFGGQNWQLKSRSQPLRQLWRTAQKSWGRSQGMLHQKQSAQNVKRLPLVKENQTSQVKELSTFLSLGRCESLGSLKSFFQ